MSFLVSLQSGKKLACFDRDDLFSSYYPAKVSIAIPFFLSRDPKGVLQARVPEKPTPLKSLKERIGIGYVEIGRKTNVFVQKTFIVELQEQATAKKQFSIMKETGEPWRKDPFDEFIPLSEPNEQLLEENWLDLVELSAHLGDSDNSDNSDRISQIVENGEIVFHAVSGKPLMTQLFETSLERSFKSADPFPKWDALMYAACYGKIQIIKKMDPTTSVLNQKYQPGGNTPLMAVVSRDTDQYDCFSKMISYLLTEKNVNADLFNDKGLTALMLASQLGHYWTVQHLRSLRVNLNLVNESGETALSLAVSEGQAEVVDELLKAEQLINLDSAKRLLRQAAHKGYVQIAQALVEAKEKRVRWSLSQKGGQSEAVEPEVKKQMLAFLTAEDLFEVPAPLTIAKDHERDNVVKYLSERIAHFSPATQPTLSREVKAGSEQGCCSIL